MYHPAALPPSPQSIRAAIFRDLHAPDPPPLARVFTAATPVTCTVIAASRKREQPSERTSDEQRESTGAMEP